MADSAFKTQVSKDENANAVSNQIWVALTDGTNAVTVTGNKLDVNATVVLDTAYTDDAAFTIGTDKVNAQGFLADETATDSVDEGDIGLARMTLDRRMITSSEQSGTWNIGTVTTLTGITNDVNIADGGNSITVDGTVAATQSGTWNIGTVASITADVSIDDGGNSITVDATQLDIDDLDATSDNVAISDGTDTLAINTGGSINVVPAVASSGTEVHDYKTATPAAAASDNHDYTVTGTTFLLQKVAWSGSGKIKVEVKVGPIASLATKYVGFSEKDTDSEIEFTPAIPVPATSTGTVRVIVTNRQGTGVDVYSTIMGEDI